jgi:FHA domain
MDDTAHAAGEAAGSARLALIELQGRDGRPQQALPVLAWPLTIGRALDNHLVIDDPFVAAHHALIAPGPDGTLQLHVGNTHNGVQLGKRHLAVGAAEPLPAGGTTLTLGQTTLRLRLPGEVLAPERRLLPSRGWAAPLVMAAVLVALVLVGHWISLDPGADTVAWLPTLTTLPVLVALWCGGWALASKIFQHRFEFTAHLRIVLPWLLAIELVSLLLPPIAAGLGWPALWRLVQPLQLVLVALLVRQHLVHVLPQAERRVSLAVASALVVGGAISLALTHRATDRFSRPPYMSALPLPALNWTTTVDPATLVQELEPLAQRLQRRVRQASEEERDDADGPAGS